MNVKTDSPYSPRTIGILAGLCVLNKRIDLFTAGSIVAIVVRDSEIEVVLLKLYCRRCSVEIEQRPVVAAVVFSDVVGTAMAENVVVDTPVADVDTVINGAVDVNDVVDAADVSNIADAVVDDITGNLMQ